VVSSTPQLHFTPGKDPVPIVQEAGWAQGWSGQAENLVPTGIRSRTIQTIVAILTELPGPPLFSIDLDKIISKWQKEDITGIPFSKNQQKVNSFN